MVIISYGDSTLALGLLHCREVELLTSEDVNLLAMSLNALPEDIFYCICMYTCLATCHAVELSVVMHLLFFGNWNCLVFQKKFPHNVRFPNSNKLEVFLVSSVRV